MLFLVIFGAIWALLNGPQKIDKDPQVGRIHGLMSKLKDKPLTISSGLFF
jgi:hypothetical protein